MIKRIALLFGISVLLSAGAFAQATGSISGRVTFGDAPLHEASLQIVELRRTTVTDNDGRYTFSDLPPGRYVLIAHQEGFADVSRSVTVTAGATATADFRLQIRGVRESVTVTASGSEQPVFEAIASVSTVDQNLVRERASVGLGEVLDGEPGVAKRSLGPGNARPVIRGFDGDRVLILADGARVGSLASQSGDHAEPLDPLSAERIEIVKGPATLLYGSNAIGGVVNVITGHDEGPHPGIRAYITGIGGTNNRQGAGSAALE